MTTVSILVLVDAALRLTPLYPVPDPAAVVSILVLVDAALRPQMVSGHSAGKMLFQSLF